MSIMFNEICINEEMLPKYTYIYIYVGGGVDVGVGVCVCVCACICSWAAGLHLSMFD